MKYSASMVSCLFWFQETRKTAELLQEGLNLAEIRKRVVEENTYQVRASERAVRIAGVAVRRLSALPEELQTHFLTADGKTARLILLVAIMKTDLLFYEFMHTAVKEALILGEKTLSERAVTTFFDDKIRTSEEVAGFSETAIKKLKQTYIKVLIEAGVVSSATERTLIPVLIDYRLQDVARATGMMPYFSVLTGGADHV